MSKEFETLDQPLMVEIIRRRQIPAEGNSGNKKKDLIKKTTQYRIALQKRLQNHLHNLAEGG